MNSVPDPRGRYLVVKIVELHLEERLPHHPIRLETEDVDQPGLCRDRVEGVPIRSRSAVSGEGAIPDATGRRDGRAPEEIDGAVEWIEGAVVEEPHLGVSPAERRFNSKIAQIFEIGVVGRADEVVVAFDLNVAEAERPSKA